MAKERKQKVEKVKKHRFYVRNAVSTLLLIFALAVLFYPIVVNYLVAQQNAVSVQKYNQSAKSLQTSEMNQLLANAETYNRYIFAKSQNQPWKEAVPDYNSQLVTSASKMIGYISIPQINVTKVPIFSGDSETILNAGVGHIMQTSLPIGGLNTHAVLSAHSGRVNNTLFTDLEDLKLGDVFYIYSLNRTLKYQIDDRKIVQPNDVSSLNVVAGKDLVTLITCWPTGINNMRLLVTGHRVALDLKLPQEGIQRNRFGYNFWVMLGSGLLVLGALLLAWLSILRRRRHIIRVDRAQFSAIRSGNQKLLIAAKEILNADSHRKSRKSYKEGDRVILKAWELVVEADKADTGRTSTYFRLKKSVWEKCQSSKAEKKKAKLAWLADSVAFNSLERSEAAGVGSIDVNLAKKFARKKGNRAVVSLSEASNLIQSRLGSTELPADCVLLGLELK